AELQPQAAGRGRAAEPIPVLRPRLVAGGARQARRPRGAPHPPVSLRPPALRDRLRVLRPRRPLAVPRRAATGAHRLTRSGLRGAKPRAGLLAGPHDLVAAGADADEADGDAGELAHEREVVARLARELLLAARLADLTLEAGQLLVLGPRRVQDRLVVG